MDRWLEVVGRGAISGNGSREADGNHFPFQYDNIEVMRSYTLLKITSFDYNLWSYNQAQICRYMMYCGQYGSTEHNSEHYSEILKNAARCPSFNAEYDPECDLNSSLVILSHKDPMPIVHISKAYAISVLWHKDRNWADNSAGITTTTTSNYRTWCAGMRHCEMRSPHLKADSGNCTRRGSNNCTPTMAESAPRQAMANIPTDESRSGM